MYIGRRYRFETSSSAIRLKEARDSIEYDVDERRKSSAWRGHYLPVIVGDVGVPHKTPAYAERSTLDKPKCTQKKQRLHNDARFRAGFRGILFRQLLIVACLLALIAPTTANAQILVLSPHPDDDIITSAGIIYDAHRRGEAVTVVYLTNGDYNGIDWGFIRQNEAVAAQDYLGTRETDLIFLGYPDGYTKTVYDDYPNATEGFDAPNGQSFTYGNRGLGASDYHFYHFGVHGLYNRANMVLDLKTILQTYRPAHIFTTSQYDKHDDHATAYRVLKDALTDVLMDSSYRPVIHTTVVHSPCCGPAMGGREPFWPDPADPSHYHSILPDIPTIPLVWNQRESLDVPLVMQQTSLSSNIKNLAIQAHASQNTGEHFLERFLHKDEFFWPEDPRGLNAPPIVNAGTDQLVQTGDTVTLNGTASLDPEGQPLIFQWTQVDGPPVTLMGAGTVGPTFTAPHLAQTTSLVFRLVVGDGQYVSPPDLVTVTVSASAGGSGAPATPSGLVATAASSSQINLTWVDNATNETSYRVERSTDGTNFTTLATLGANVTNYANTGLTASTTYYYRVLASNSVGNSGYSNIASATTSAAGTSTNIAPLAAVTASSENPADGQQAIKAVDGVVDGWPGDYTREWATNGQRTGAWIKLTWSAFYLVDKIVLYDRPNSNDRVTGGTLTFSDGSSLTVTSLSNNGAANAVTFTPRNVNSVTFTITSVSATTQNVGLAEIQVYGR
jgi:LmbE family N-acetylglucosaminyl deacetylase